MKGAGSRKYVLLVIFILGIVLLRVGHQLEGAHALASQIQGSFAKSTFLLFNNNNNDYFDVKT
jgi:hypothetical protein